MMAQSRQLGFTLLEVMVALAIFAVAAIALTKAGMSFTQGVMSLTDRSLAHVVAMNEAASLRINQSWPEGSGEQIVESQGRQWRVRHQVYPTPSDDVRRVELRVFEYLPNESNAPAAQIESTEPSLSSLVVFLRRETNSESNE